MNKIRPKRSGQFGHRPLADVRSEGELYINSADHQIGYHDKKGMPVDLVAVRTFSESSAYHAGDLVAKGGKIYKAIVDISKPGFFNPARWKNIAQSSVAPTALPAPKVGDRGKALVVDPAGKPQWGARIDNFGQIIFGGQF